MLTVFMGLRMKFALTAQVVCGGIDTALFTYLEDS